MCAGVCTLLCIVCFYVSMVCVCVCVEDYLGCFILSHMISYTQITQSFPPLSFSIKKSECTSPPPYFLSQHSHVPFTKFSLSVL